MSEEPSLLVLILSIVFLLLLSAFFSGSETGMMASNKIKLRNKAKSGQKNSKRALELLAKPDNLLSVILVGNNFANILASALVTILMINFFESRVLLGSIVLTIIILIFSEITPKTTASAYPENFASKSSWVLSRLSVVFRPIVFFTNQVSSRLLKLLNVDIKKSTESDNLNTDELKTLLDDSNSLIPNDYRKMLSAVLGMDNLIVEDIMIPLAEIEGINIKDDLKKIKSGIKNSPYSTLPVYDQNISDCIGMLHLKDSSDFLTAFESNKSLDSSLSEPYFASLTTNLTKQLHAFQDTDNNIALVVDEYGEIEGLISVEDIFIEIVGKFGSDIIEQEKEFSLQPDGSVVTDGNSKIRDLNGFMNWSINDENAKTINGLILKTIDEIPIANLCFTNESYRFEILKIKNNSITSVKIQKI
ncbi:CNNM domain-containing protein [Pseudomonadota bacterium]|nr:CNNM domain-containing protein [Pseudomonadota bacterium]